LSEITVRYEPELAAEDRSTVIDGLVSYNTEQGYVWERVPLNVLARDADGRVVGGLLGEISLGWLFVSALWVDSACRGSGVGTRLVATAEARAAERGCEGIYLDTFSFQARPFYERLGFERFGELEDCPRGGAKYYFRKRLAPSDPR
jgi:GNAT superfamily N-acetyltransferase